MVSTTPSRIILPDTEMKTSNIVTMGPSVDLTIFSRLNLIHLWRKVNLLIGRLNLKQNSQLVVSIAHETKMAMKLSM